MVETAAEMPDKMIETLGDELFELKRARLLALLARLSYERREVILASGRKSDFYIDCKQTVLTAEGHFLAGSLFLSVIRQRSEIIEAIGGLTMGADPLASAASTLSYVAGRPLTAFYVRKEAKAHGLQRKVEGPPLEPGERCLIVEDVVTTGGSALKAIERARGFGLEVKLIVGLVDREEGGREALEAEAPLVTLFRKRDFA
jgi:orotate phosphoribosyltransferase